VGYGLGVDVGATFTAAAVTREAGVEMVVLGDQGVVVPSVVFAREDGTLLAGAAAAARAPGDPGRVAREFKRRLGDPTPVVLGGVPYPPAALLAALVRDAVAAAAEVEGGPPDRVVLTRPALWGPFRREQFEEVALLSGLDEALTTTEPEAAATYYASGSAASGRPPAGGPAEGPAEGTGELADGAVVAVYDLGGGTFDTTVLRAGREGLEILGTPEGVDQTGGVTFDEVVFRYVDEALDGAVGALDPTVSAAAAALLRLRQDCTLAKETLSAQLEVTIPVFLPDQHLQVTLTRAEFERRIGPAVETTLDAVHRALRSAQVAPAGLAEVLLVGGSSRIPLIARRLAGEFGAPIRTSRHPKHAVALGAAIIAGRAIAQPSPANPANPVDSAAVVPHHRAGAAVPELSASSKVLYQDVGTPSGPTTPGTCRRRR
jgi:molecular chaperone DnaK